MSEFSREEVRKTLGSIGKRSYTDPGVQKAVRLQKEKQTARKIEVPSVVSKETVRRVLGSTGRRSYKDPSIQESVKAQLKIQKIKETSKKPLETKLVTRIESTKNPAIFQKITVKSINGVELPGSKKREIIPLSRLRREFPEETKDLYKTTVSGSIPRIQVVGIGEIGERLRVLTKEEKFKGTGSRVKQFDKARVGIRKSIEQIKRESATKVKGKLKPKEIAGIGEQGQLIIKKRKSRKEKPIIDKEVLVRTQEVQSVRPKSLEKYYDKDSFVRRKIEKGQYLVDPTKKKYKPVSTLSVVRKDDIKKLNYGKLIDQAYGVERDVSVKKQLDKYRSGGALILYGIKRGIVNIYQMAKKGSPIQGAVNIKNIATDPSKILQGYILTVDNVFYIIGNPDKIIAQEGKRFLEDPAGVFAEYATMFYIQRGISKVAMNKEFVSRYPKRKQPFVREIIKSDTSNRLITQIKNKFKKRPSKNTLKNAFNNEINKVYLTNKLSKVQQLRRKVGKQSKAIRGLETKRVVERLKKQDIKPKIAKKETSKFLNTVKNDVDRLNNTIKNRLKVLGVSKGRIESYKSLFNRIKRKINVIKDKPTLDRSKFASIRKNVRDLKRLIDKQTTKLRLKKIKTKADKKIKGLETKKVIARLKKKEIKPKIAKKETSKFLNAIKNDIDKLDNTIKNKLKVAGVSKTRIESYKSLFGRIERKVGIIKNKPTLDRSKFASIRKNIRDLNRLIDKQLKKVKIKTIKQKIDKKVKGLEIKKVVSRLQKKELRLKLAKKETSKFLASVDNKFKGLKYRINTTLKASNLNPNKIKSYKDKYNIISEKIKDIKIKPTTDQSKFLSVRRDIEKLERRIREELTRLRLKTVKQKSLIRRGKVALTEFKPIRDIKYISNKKVIKINPKSNKVLKTRVKTINDIVKDTNVKGGQIQRDGTVLKQKLSKVESATKQQLKLAQKVKTSSKKISLKNKQRVKQIKLKLAQNQKLANRLRSKTLLSNQIVKDSFKASLLLNIALRNISTQKQASVLLVKQKDKQKQLNSQLQKLLILQKTIQKQMYDNVLALSQLMKLSIKDMVQAQQYEQAIAKSKQKQELLTLQEEILKEKKKRKLRKETFKKKKVSKRKVTKKTRITKFTRTLASIVNLAKSNFSKAKSKGVFTGFEVR